MPHFAFLPQWPFAANSLLLFGALLIAGILGGEFTRRVLRLPRITGYVLVGMLMGPSGLRLLNGTLIGDAWVFVEIALGLLLFELGRRLDLGWFRRDPWLAITGLIASALAFGCIYYALVWLEVAPLLAAVAAAIGISTSPAVLLLVAHDMKAEGQVTERALHLAAINSSVAYILVTVLIPFIHQEHRGDATAALLHPLYLMGGALLIGAAASALTLMLARCISRQSDRHYLILLGMVIAAVGGARVLELPVPLSLLTFGILVHHMDKRHALDTVDMGRIGQLFFVVLFVVCGAKVLVQDLMTGAVLALAFILARFAGTAAGVMSLTHFSGLRPGTAGLLTIALTPMSGLALAMVQGTADIFPAFGAKLAAIVLSAVLMLDLIGPLAVQFALKRAGETAETT